MSDDNGYIFVKIEHTGNSLNNAMKEDKFMDDTLRMTGEFINRLLIVTESLCGRQRGQHTPSSSYVVVLEDPLEIKEKK